MLKMKIAFDLDGVVMDTQSVLFDILESNYNYDRRRQNEYNITIPSLSYNECEDVVYNIVMNYTDRVEPLNNAHKYLKIIYNKLQEPLIFVTARDKELKEVTDDWVNKWIEPPHRVFYVSNSRKHRIVNRLSLTHFVEDRFRNAQEISEVCDFVYLVNQRWNKGRIPNHNIKRIQNLGKIVDDIRSERYQWT